MRYRSDRAQQDLDARSLGELAHRNIIVDNGLVGVIRLAHHVLTEVIGTRHDGNCLGFEGDDILLEAYQHLAGSLTRDAATDEVVAGEEVRISVIPVVRNGVSHQYDKGGGSNLRVGSLITLEIPPVTGTCLTGGTGGSGRTRRGGRRRKDTLDLRNYDSLHSLISCNGGMATVL